MDAMDYLEDVYLYILLKIWDFPISHGSCLFTRQSVPFIFAPLCGLGFPWFRKPLMIRDIGRYWFTTCSFKMVRFGWWSRSQPSRRYNMSLKKKGHVLILKHVFNFTKTNNEADHEISLNQIHIMLWCIDPASHHVSPKVGISGDNPLDIDIFCCWDWDLLGKHRWFCHWCSFQRVATSCWDWDPSTYRAIWKPFADDWWEL